jgi:hypothetical protein
MSFSEKNNGTIITNNIYAENIFSGNTNLNDIFLLKTNIPYPQNPRPYEVFIHNDKIYVYKKAYFS